MSTAAALPMPTSPESERAILGSILLDNRCYLQAAAIVNADDFSLDTHRRLFTVVSELIDNGAPVDPVTMTEALVRRKWLQAVGGIAYFSGLTDGLPHRPNIEHYAQIVRDKAQLRGIIQLGQRACAAAFDQDESPDEVLQDVQQCLIDLLYHGRNTALDVKAAAHSTLDRLLKIRDTLGECIGAPTGLAGLDVLTTGFRESEFYVIGARPGQGKTALMCQGIVAQVAAGWKPGVFSVEVDHTQIITRLACQVSGISVFETRDPRTLTQAAFNCLGDAIAEVAGWDFSLDDSPRMTLKELSAIARMWVARGCNVLWVDFLQKLRVPGAKNDFERVTAIADGLWALARTTKVPVVALSQLRRTDEEPTLEDFRQSGEIEQNANAALAIYRPKEGNIWTGEDKVLVLKQRSGPSGIHVPVAFNGPVGKFEER